MKSSTSIMFLSTDQSRLILEIRPKRKTLLFPEMRVTKRNLHPGGCKFILLFDLIDFFLNLHLKNYSNKNSMENNSNSKTRNPTFYCWKKKKRWIRPNKFASGKLNSEFCWRNVFHYRLKIQSLTQTLHCISQTLQLAH